MAKKHLSSILKATIFFIGINLNLIVLIYISLIGDVEYLHNQ